jgi:hypothetical protein
MIPEILLGKRVVIDTNSEYTVVGTLVAEKDGYLVLDEVDLHSGHDATTHQDIYLSDISSNGVQVNRKRIYLLLSRVIAVTDLDDVISY